MIKRQLPGADTGPANQRAPLRHPEVGLLHLYGSHSLAFFGLASENEHFLAPGNQGLISYFKQKFAPCWESRYLVTNSRLALPKTALAVLRLRNYSGREFVRLLTR
jgi:hypothetical protein